MPRCSPPSSRSTPSMPISSIDEQKCLRYERTEKNGEMRSAFKAAGEVQISLPGDKSPASPARSISPKTASMPHRHAAPARWIANPDHVLVPGQFVRRTRRQPAHQAVLVPAASVTADLHGRCFTSSAPMTASPPSRSSSAASAGRMREITRCLDATDRMVVSGIQRVQSSAKVTVRNGAHQARTNSASKGEGSCEPRPALSPSTDLCHRSSDRHDHHRRHRPLHLPVTEYPDVVPPTVVVSDDLSPRVRTNRG